MDKPISVGDLVQVIRWPHDCFPRTSFPTIFTVLEIHPMNPRCPRCDEQVALGDRSAMLRHNGKNTGLPLSWLKRIPPLSEMEGEKRDEEITA